MTSLELAHHVHGFRLAAMTEAARDAALRCVLDLLCAAAAGQRGPGVQAAQRASVALFGTGDSSVWFTGRSASPCAALLANSSAAAAQDLDDGYRQARGHPGAAVIPAAWAMLQQQADEADAAERWLAAIIVGYEVGLRVAMGRLSYAPSGAWAPHAAIAAAGRLLGTGPDALAQAFGIAAQTAPALPGLAGLMGSDVKEGIPWGSVTGLAALQLAEAGATGPAHIFDDATLFNARPMVEGLGQTALIEGVYFKPFACCRHIHAPLEAYVALAAQHGFSAADVLAVDVHTYRALQNLSNLPDPHSLVEAQYSLPYCLALCAVAGPEALVPMQAHRLDDLRVVELARRVAVHHDLQIEALFPARSPASVTVTLRDGERLRSPVTDPRGDPATALSWQELEAKFLLATRPLLGPQRQDQLLQAVHRLRQGDLAPLRQALH